MRYSLGPLVRGARLRQTITRFVQCGNQPIRNIVATARHCCLIVWRRQAQGRTPDQQQSGSRQCSSAPLHPWKTLDSGLSRHDEKDFDDPSWREEVA